MTARRTTPRRSSDVAVGRLEARRAAIARSVEALHGEAADAMEHRDLSDLYDVETVSDADVGVTLTLATKAERTLAKLDAAIARVEAGEYGRCAGCGGSISQERLRALPATSKCIRCSRKASLAGQF